ncbi:hypothetical protein MUP77_13410, partial [Candidatus Bathyarchaeota archaeon]|nr:hypothetical protein [Candidatus Bathyarchaeota archaeon]
AVMAPGPTRSGIPMGTAPIVSDEEFSFQLPVIKSLTAIIKSNKPPAIMKLCIKIPKKDNIRWPAMAKDIRRMKPTIVAVLNVFFLSSSLILLVRLIEIGMFPKGSTMMKSAIVTLTNCGITVEKISTSISVTSHHLLILILTLFILFFLDMAQDLRCVVARTFMCLGELESTEIGIDQTV